MAALVYLGQLTYAPVPEHSIHQRECMYHIHTYVHMMAADLGEATSQLVVIAARDLLLPPTTKYCVHHGC